MLIAFLLPMACLVPVIIAVMLINWLVEGDFKNKFQRIIKNKTAILFMFFYLLFLLGLTITENLNSGFFDVQVKLTLLFFPVFFCSRPVEASRIKFIYYAFVSGATLVSLVMLFNAVYIYITLGRNNFFYMDFSIFMHPGYLSMYLNVALMILMMDFLKNEKQIFPKRIVIFLILFFSFINVLLSSKISLLIMSLSYFSFFGYYIFNRKKYLAGIIGIFVIVISIYSIVNFIPEISGRINKAIAVVSSDKINLEDSESTAVRLLIWKAADAVIIEHLSFGVGTGDVEDELFKEYESRRMTGALEHSLNAHNQFIQTFVSIGIIGFLTLIACLGIPLIQGMKSKNFVFVFFIFIVSLNFMVESMLETQAGVIFYAFFNSLLFFKSKD